MIIQSISPRMIRWMMAKEYFELSGLHSVFRTIGAIPVERGGRDLSATRTALRALQDGWILGVFPEGKIEESAQLLPFQTGVAMMAIKTGVPVYPAYLEGTIRRKGMIQAILQSNLASIRFGPAMQFSGQSTQRDNLNHVSLQLHAEVAKMREMERSLWGHHWPGLGDKKIGISTVPGIEGPMG